MPARPSEFVKRTAAQVTGTDYFIGRDPEVTTGTGAGAAGIPFEILATELATYINGLGAAADAEFVRDTVAAYLVSANPSTLTITPDDPGDTLTLNATASVGGTVTQEQIEDAVGALAAAATATERCAVVYGDNGAGAGALTVYPTAGVGAVRPAHREGLLFWDTTLTTP